MAKSVIGLEVNLNAEQAKQSVGSFRQQLRIATQDLVAMSEKFGVTSVEAANAAKKVAGLKDAIGDAKALADTFNPDKKFVALSGALNGAVSGFSALQGAMGLFGSESEDVQKMLLKVNSAMALQQGISGIAESIDSFKILAGTIKTKVVEAFSTLKGAVLATGIGALAVGVGILIANFDKLKEAITGVSKGQALLNTTQEDYNKGATQAIENTNKVKVAFDLAKKGVISKEEALATYNETLGDSFGKTNDLTVAEKNLTDKAEAYIKITGLKAQANALFALSAQQSAKAVLAASDDQISFWDKTKIVVKGIFNKNGAELITDASKAQAEGVTIAVNDANANADLLKNKGEELLKQAGEIGKQYGVNANISGGKKTGGKKATNLAESKGEDSRAEEMKNRRDALLQEQDYEKKAWEDKNKFIVENSAIATDALGQDLLKRSQQYVKETEVKKFNADQQKKIDEEVAKNRQLLLEQTGLALTGLSNVIGRETGVGKALAVASALIDTYSGIAKGVKLGFPAAIPAVIAASATGFAAVKNIMKVKVPGTNNNTGGTSIPSIGRGASAPLEAGYTSTKLDPFALNQIGNAAARAYVIESDVSGNQERVRRLNRAARIV